MEIGLADADLLVSLTAIGHAMQAEFDPQRFLDEFSAQIQRLIPHDRLVVDHLDDGGRTSSTTSTTPPPRRPRHATS
jgi:hypothetical protein